jgi:hypothetical protein
MHVFYFINVLYAYKFRELEILGLVRGNTTQALLH